jgi:hypothetical protein
MSTDYWARVYELDLCVQATSEESLPHCYRILSRLYGVEDSLLVEAQPGECDDRCGREGGRFQIGRMRLCRFCALRRSRAMKRAA